MLLKSSNQMMAKHVIIQLRIVPFKALMSVLHAAQHIIQETITTNVIPTLTIVMITLMLFVITVKPIIIRKMTQLLVSRTFKTVQLMIMPFVRTVNQHSTKEWEDQLVSLTLISVRPMLTSMKPNAKIATLTGKLKTELLAILSFNHVLNMKPLDQNARPAVQQLTNQVMGFTVIPTLTIAITTHQLTTHATLVIPLTRNQPVAWSAILPLLTVSIKLMINVLTVALNTIFQEIVNHVSLTFLTVRTTMIQNVFTVKLATIFQSTNCHVTST